MLNLLWTALEASTWSIECTKSIVQCRWGKGPICKSWGQYSMKWNPSIPNALSILVGPSGASGPILGLKQSMLLEVICHNMFPSPNWCPIPFWTATKGVHYQVYIYRLTLSLKKSQGCCKVFTLLLPQASITQYKSIPCPGVCISVTMQGGMQEVRVPSKYW